MVVVECARQGVSANRCGEESLSPERTRQGEPYSQTARVSFVRRNLKEAESKALVRRTATVYEADAMDKRAQLLKVRYLYGNRGSRCGGHKREGRMHYPGRSDSLPALT